jgi:hypothetical protein
MSKAIHLKMDSQIDNALCGKEPDQWILSSFIKREIKYKICKDCLQALKNKFKTYE